MAVLKNCSDRGGELFVALAALIQARRGLSSVRWLRFSRFFGLGIFAMGANGAVRPSESIPDIPAPFISVEMLIYFVQRQFIGCRQHVRFHALNIA